MLGLHVLECELGGGKRQTGVRWARTEPIYTYGMSLGMLSSLASVAPTGPAMVQWGNHRTEKRLPCLMLALVPFSVDIAIKMAHIAWE